MNVTILDPNTGNTRTITVTLGASPIIQDMSGALEYYVVLSTTAKDVTGNAISSQMIKGVYSGAGAVTPTITNGANMDRKGVLLAGNKYADLSTAIDDYVAMMVEGYYQMPSTEMAFS